MYSKSGQSTKRSNYPKDFLFFSRGHLQQSNYTIAEVLRRFSEGPTSGVFTDGSAQPNPGPGGWGYVYVINGEVVKADHGHDPKTTNNRMELRGLIEAYKILPPDAEVNIYSDSNLCVQTLNTWAHNWEKRGWTKKGGEIANLELVKELFALYKAHPKVKISWIKAHNGWLWNEYADSLSTAWTRKQV